MDSFQCVFGPYTSDIEFQEKEKLLAEKEGVLYVFDENTEPLFEASGIKKTVIPAGEKYKSWATVEEILRKALEEGLDRGGTIVGIGGGVLTDLASFCASVYMRGCGLELVPTTLLAMVDASIGGKTGFDFGGYKNMVGTFYPARKIRVCPQLLATLPERDFLSGLAETIKHACLGDGDLFSLLREEREKILRREKDVLKELIERSMKVKISFVERDFRETGIRAFLNLGHTFGHALESVEGFDSHSHGEAVAWGIEKAMKTGVLMGITDPAWAEEVGGLLRSYSYDLDTQVGFDDFIRAAKQDKKKRGGKVRFVLQKGPGETLLTSVEDSLLKKVLSP